MSYFHQDSIFWIEVDKINPNPYQPRKEFDEEELQSLAASIRQYGVLQALVVTRHEVPKDDGGLAVEYELISGERRLRAAKLAGVKQLPVLIRSGEENDLMKLELAIIENLQREDLNVVERARAFDKLANEFTLNKTQIAKKVGKSREYVSNTLRVLSLPEEILDALSSGKLSEGHARPLMMLGDRPDEQQTLFKEILYRKISVREAERVAKKIAKDKVRKASAVDPEIEELEREFTESLGTRVHIESKEVGGKISIDYFSQDDLRSLLDVLRNYKQDGNASMLESFIASAEEESRNRQEGNEPPVTNDVPAEEGNALSQHEESVNDAPDELSDYTQKEPSEPHLEGRSEQRSSEEEVLPRAHEERISSYAQAAEHTPYEQNDPQEVASTPSESPEPDTSVPSDTIPPTPTSVERTEPVYNTERQVSEEDSRYMTTPSSPETEQPPRFDPNETTGVNEKGDISRAAEGSPTTGAEDEEGDDLYSVRNFTV